MHHLDPNQLVHVPMPFWMYEAHFVTNHPSAAVHDNDTPAVLMTTSPAWHSSYRMTFAIPSTSSQTVEQWLVRYFQNSLTPAAWQQLIQQYGERFDVVVGPSHRIQVCAMKDDNDKNADKQDNVNDATTNSTQQQQQSLQPSSSTRRRRKRKHSAATRSENKSSVLPTTHFPTQTNGSTRTSNDYKQLVVLHAQLVKCGDDNDDEDGNHAWDASSGLYHLLHSQHQLQRHRHEMMLMQQPQPQQRQRRMIHPTRTMVQIVSRSIERRSSGSSSTAAATPNSFTRSNATATATTRNSSNDNNIAAALPSVTVIRLPAHVWTSNNHQDHQDNHHIAKRRKTYAYIAQQQGLNAAASEEEKERHESGAVLQIDADSNGQAKESGAVLSQSQAVMADSNDKQAATQQEEHHGGGHNDSDGDDDSSNSSISGDSGNDDHKSIPSLDASNDLMENDEHQQEDKISNNEKEKDRGVKHDRSKKVGKMQNASFATVTNAVCSTNAVTPDSDKSPRSVNANKKPSGGSNEQNGMLNDNDQDADTVQTCVSTSTAPVSPSIASSGHSEQAEASAIVHAEEPRDSSDGAGPTQPDTETTQENGVEISKDDNDDDSSTSSSGSSSSSSSSSSSDEARFQNNGDVCAEKSEPPSKNLTLDEKSQQDDNESVSSSSSSTSSSSANSSSSSSSSSSSGSSSSSSSSASSSSSSSTAKKQTPIAQVAPTAPHKSNSHKKPLLSISRKIIIDTSGMKH